MKKVLFLLVAVLATLGVGSSAKASIYDYDDSSERRSSVNPADNSDHD